MTDNLPTTGTNKPVIQFTEKQVSLIKNQIMRGATDDELFMFESICKRTGLDPFARQIYAVKRRAKVEGQWIDKWEFQTSVDGFRLIAERTGKYQGQTPVMWCGKDGKWTDVWLHDYLPSAAKVGVFKAGHTEPTFAVARTRSYVQTDRDGNPTTMWKKMGDLMIAKCAECLAIRKAFPQELSGLYASEEMAQADNEDHDEKPVKPKQVQSRPVQEAKKPDPPADGQYRIPFGKDCKGKTFDELGADQSMKLATWVDQKMKPGPWRTEFLAEFEKWMGRGQPVPDSDEMTAEQFENNLAGLKNHAPGSEQDELPF